MGGYERGGGQIEQDASRFRKIVRGQVRENLRKYISNGELIGRQGKDLVSIPIPQIELPTFRFGSGRGGVGQGEGEEGDPLGPGKSGKGDGAGDQPGSHILEVEFSIDELTEMIYEQVELPNLLPLPGEIAEHVWRLKGIQPTRSMKLALKRSYLRALPAAGMNPVKAMTMVNQRGIARYRSFERVPLPGAKALLVFMADISGSMTEDKREIERISAFWIKQLIDRAYEKRVHCLWLVHDTNAALVTEDEFYSYKADGGTRVSSALELCLEIVKRNPDCNIFPVHFSDGENYNSDDNRVCIELVNEMLSMPQARMYAFSHVCPGKFVDDSLWKAFSGGVRKSESAATGRYVGTKVKDPEGVLPSILEIFGKRKG